MKNKKRHQSVGFTGGRRLTSALPSLMFTRTHSPPSWLDGSWWNWKLETELRQTRFMVKTERSKSFCLLCPRTLGCYWGWSREHGGWGGGGGEDGSKQMSGQLHSPGTGSKTEIHTGSYPSIKGANVSSGSTQFFFSFCPRCTSHQSQKEIPEMSFNSMLQIFMEHLRHWYLGMVAEERLKSKDQELAGHSFPLEGKTHVPDNVFRGALFEGSLCDTLTWEGFTKETVSLAVG